MKKYDIVFVTHLPSFYKTNLYNEVAKEKNIYVIFISRGSSQRNDDFIGKEINFDHVVLNEGDLETRTKISSLLKFLRVLFSLKFKKIVVGGWELPEFWAAVIFTGKCKNAVVVESTIYEYKSSLLKDKLKSLFLSRVSTAFCSGKPHVKLIDFFRFKGDIRVTKGVGLINFNSVSKDKTTPTDFAGNFVYIGRYSPEKGLLFLIAFFAQHPELTLTLYGDGPLVDEISRRKTANVHLRNYVSNSEVVQIIQQYNVFVLPSHSEPWGLVIEESLLAGVPVICSSVVGCSKELVTEPGTGAVFEDNNYDSLRNAIDDVRDNYPELIVKLTEIDIYNKNRIHQVSAYVEW